MQLVQHLGWVFRIVGHARNFRFDCTAGTQLHHHIQASKEFESGCLNFGSWSCVQYCARKPGAGTPRRRGQGRIQGATDGLYVTMLRIHGRSPTEMSTVFF